MSKSNVPVAVFIKRKLSFLKPVVWSIIGKPDSVLAFKTHVARLSNYGKLDKFGLEETKRLFELAVGTSGLAGPLEFEHLGRSFLKYEDRNLAIRSFSKIVQNENRHQITAFLAEYFSSNCGIEEIEAFEADATEQIGKSNHNSFFDDTLWFLIGTNYLDKCKIELSLKAFKKSCEINNSRSNDVNYPILNFAFLQEDPSQIIGKVEKAFSFSSSSNLDTYLNANFYIGCANRFLLTDRIDDAFAAMKKAIGQDKSAFAHFGQPFYDYAFSRENTRTGKFKADEICNQLIKYFPVNEETKANKSVFSFETFIAIATELLKYSKIESAIKQFNNAIFVEPNSSAGVKEIITSQIGDGSFRLEEINRLVSSFNLNDNKISQMIIEKILESSKPNQKLILELLPNFNREQLLNLGNQALGIAKHDIAIAAYNRAIQKQPNDILTRLQIGVTYYLANRHKEAEANFAILNTLQAAEREKYGVTDKAGRVLHETWIQAIGHIACLDTYVKMMKLGWIPNTRPLIAFNPKHPPSGMSLLSRWSEYLDVVGVVGDPGAAIDRIIFGPNDNILDSESRDLRRVSMMNFFWALPNQQKKMRYYAAIGSDVQIAWKQAGHGPLLSISKNEEVIFRSTMEQAFGLPKDAWFVLLHVREDGYKTGWEEHHNYTRNAKIEDYDECIDRIIEKGGWVIRGGDPSMKPVKPRQNLIDYAISPLKSPELDILICAKAKFFFGTNSGFSLIPPLFGTPCLLTNWSPIANPNWYPDDIFIPKTVLNRTTGEKLTFAELLGSLAGWSQFHRDFQTEWLVIDNTPAELIEALEEMLARIFDGAKPSAEDETRQKIFNSIVLENGGYIGSRLSDNYLRKNAALLGSNSKPANRKRAKK